MPDITWSGQPPVRYTLRMGRYRGGVQGATSRTVGERDQDIAEALRRGDEPLFSALVARLHPAMVRLAAAYVRDPGVAEEVAQEAWLGVLRGLPRYEGRSALRTWIFSILLNQAKSRAERERRTIPFSAVAPPDVPAVEPERFLPADHPRWPRWWDEYPSAWDDIPEDRLVGEETVEVVRRAIEGLPRTQRIVITLRDVDGLSAPEACSVLGITETNQRVLLHRARSRVRRALERYLDEEPS